MLTIFTLQKQFLNWSNSALDDGTLSNGWMASMFAKYILFNTIFNFWKRKIIPQREIEWIDGVDGLLLAFGFLSKNY